MIKYRIVCYGDSTTDTRSVKGIEAENKQEAIIKAQKYIDDNGKSYETYYLMEYIRTLKSPPVKELKFDLIQAPI